MSSTATAGKPARKGRGESSYAVYRVGGTTPEIRFTVQLVLAARRWRSLLDEHLRPIQQSSARMEAMSAILNSPPLSAQVDIAKRLRIEGPTLTRMLDTLEKDGLVERLPDPADRRTNKLRLTPAGERALEEIFEIVDVLRARLLDGASPEMIEQGNEFLGGLLDKLDAGLPPVEGE
jgi:MarR family transcriptional regulator for hemolysin